MNMPKIKSTFRYSDFLSGQSPVGAATEGDRAVTLMVDRSNYRGTTYSSRDQGALSESDGMYRCVLM